LVPDHRAGCRVGHKARKYQGGVRKTLSGKIQKLGLVRRDLGWPTADFSRCNESCDQINYLWQVCVVAFHFQPAAAHCAFVFGSPAIDNGTEAANSIPVMTAPPTILANI
jgi:hypothetical protein